MTREPVTRPGTGSAPLRRRVRASGVLPALCALFLWGAAAPGAYSDAPVADAAMRGDVAAVRALLQQGADVNAAQGDGMTALHWAAEHGDGAMAEMLVYAGARTAAVTRNGSLTPLHLAGRAGSAEVIQALLAGGADPGATTTSGQATALHFVAAQGNAPALALLVDAGAQVDAREVFGQTPLMWAAAAGRTEAATSLVRLGADVAATAAVVSLSAVEDSLGEKRSARNRRLAALRAADEPPAETRAGSGQAQGGQRTAQQRQQATPSRANATEEAAADTTPAAPPPPPVYPYPVVDSTSPIQTGSVGYADMVGEKGGLSPLLFAIRDGHAATALALLDAGADVNQQSEGDETSPLLMATMNGHFDLALELLARGADVNTPSHAGATPLFAAINVQWAPKALYPQPVAYQQQKASYLEVMEAYLEAGADPNARTYMHLWYMSYNFDLLRVNTTGATPFWRAAYATDVPAMRLLKRYGADHTIATVKTGRSRGGDDDDAGEEPELDASGLPDIVPGGPAVYAIHAASGVGYGEGYAANAHRHAPDGWLPAVKYLVEELGVDINARDLNGYNAVHHAAARGDNELIRYLASQGADIMAVSRRGQTTVDMANGPVQRVPPFLDTVALLETMGAINNHNCRSCE